MRLPLFALILMALVSRGVAEPPKKKPLIYLECPTGWVLTIYPHGSATLSRDDNLNIEMRTSEGSFDYERLIKSLRPLYEVSVRTMHFEDPETYHLDFVETDVIQPRPIPATPEIRELVEQADLIFSEEDARRFAEARHTKPLLPPKKR